MTTFIFGEAMLEYHSHGGAGLRYGGDTLNTAIHLARAGHEVAYVTAVGTDPISDALVDAWAAEGIDTSVYGSCRQLEAGQAKEGRTLPKFLFRGRTARRS